MAEPSFTLAAVQQRASDTIVAQLSTMKPSPWLYDMLPGGSRDVGHLAYGVGIVESRPVDQQGKQRAGEALNAEARVGVRIMYALRSADAEVAYRGGLAISDLVVAAMIDTADSDGANATQKWWWNSTTARVVADGTYLLIEQRYTCWFLVTNSL